MNQNIKKLLMAMAIIYLLFSLFQYMSFMFIRIDNSHADEVSNRLQEQVNNQQSFIASEVTPFTWDKVYIFSPYTTRNMMEEVVGSKWAASRSYLGWQIEKRTDPLPDDGIITFIFVKEDQVVCDLRWTREDGDLLFLVEESPLNYNDEVVFEK